MTKTDFRHKLRGATMTTDEIGGIVLDPADNVKRAGYRSHTDQIRELKRAGLTLEAARDEQYNEPTGISARMYGEIDITVAREKTAELQKQLKERKRLADEQKKAAEEEKAAEAAKAQEAPQKAPETPENKGGVT